MLRAAKSRWTHWGREEGEGGRGEGREGGGGEGERGGEVESFKVSRRQRHTLKPVYSDHLWAAIKVVLVGRWSRTWIQVVFN